MFTILPSRCYLPVEATLFDRDASEARSTVFRKYKERAGVAELYGAMVLYTRHLFKFLKERGPSPPGDMQLFEWQIARPTRELGPDGNCEVTFLNVVHPVVEYTVAVYSTLNLAIYTALECSCASEETPRTSEDCSAPPLDQRECWLDAMAYGHLLMKLYRMFGNVPWFKKIQISLPQAVIEILYGLSLAKVQHLIAREESNTAKKKNILFYALRILARCNSHYEQLQAAGYRSPVLNRGVRPLLIIEQAKTLANICITITEAEEKRGWADFESELKKNYSLTREPVWDRRLTVSVLCFGLWYLEIVARQVSIGSADSFVRKCLAVYGTRIEQVSTRMREQIITNHFLSIGMSRPMVDIDKLSTDESNAGLYAFLRQCFATDIKKPLASLHEQLEAVRDRTEVLLNP